jgi:hypothetical protein
MESKARLLGHAIHTITVPATILELWAAKGFPMPSSDFVDKGLDANGRALKRIQYKELDLKAPWNSFDLAHDLSKEGRLKNSTADYEAKEDGRG